MDFITGKYLPRRTFLRGAGAAIALPFMDAMVPAGRLWRDPTRQTAASTRLVCIEESMGAAGSNRWGDSQHLFSPAQVGRDFEIAPTSQLASLQEFQDYMTIVSDTDCRMAEAYNADEIGGDHDRSTGVFLTQSHPKQTQGSDLFLGTSLDQIHARRVGTDTALPSLELCLEGIDRGGGCAGLQEAVMAEHHAPKDHQHHRLRIQLPLRLYDHARLGLSRPAASPDPRATRGLRAALRVGRYAGRPGRPTEDGPEHDRLDRDRGRAAETGARGRGSRGSGRVRHTHPRDRAPNPTRRSTQRER